jgi:hypothetical protein
LRYVYLKTAKHPQTQLSFPPQWGAIGDTLLRQIIANVNFKNAVKPVLDASKKAKNKPEPGYRLEKQFRANINDRTKYAPLELSGYILESPVFAMEFLKNRHLIEDNDFDDDNKMKGVEFIIELMKEESKQTRRWQTMVYNHPDPPPGNPNIIKKPAGTKANTSNPTAESQATPPNTPPPPPIAPAKRLNERIYWVPHHPLCWHPVKEGQRIGTNQMHSPQALTGLRSTKM